MNGKNFVAIGKMFIDSPDTEWNIPHLHFIVNKTPSGQYEATNIELFLDSCGSTLEDAVAELSGLTIHHITTVMEKGCGYKEFIECVDTEAMDDYWRAYRVIEFTLAEKGRDLSHEITKRINAAIKSRLAEEIKQQIIEMGKQIAETRQEVSEMKLKVELFEAA